MKVQSCKFVDASDIFTDCGNAWEIFCESEPDCTWGDNNRSLVTPELIIDTLEGADVGEQDQADVNKAIGRLESLINTVIYVDLEN